RHVALKVLAFHGIMKPTYLERFSLEACAAARLHHTNIVPVFGIGEHQGIHYYAMQFIQGQGLDMVLKEVRRLRRQPTVLDQGKSDSCRELTVSIAHSLITGQVERPLSADSNPEQRGPNQAILAPADAATSDSSDQAIARTFSNEDSGLAGQ